MASIYDHPLYYDILFGWDRSEEAGFYASAFARHGLKPNARILEVCSGTGQVGLRLARKGWQITGLDIRPEMLEFMEAAAKDQDLSIHTLHGDMRNFSSHLFDGAYCPANSFRLLEHYDEMTAHLQSVSANLRHDGIYVLDMFFSAPERGGADMDTWTMQRDGVEVASMGDRIVVDDTPAKKKLTLDWGGTLRRYSFAEFMEIIGRSPGFDIASCHPVHRETRDGISIFHIDDTSEEPDGRTIVILTHSVDKEPLD
ncbi:MAG: class I SAM-dependent methyltransferase [Pseudomonadales bacterium]|jgi:SAM-dependent methyltransferase|nr:class I SAM-dependent methyltransferase [Pseudomonadales bacterium]MDP7356897.1 class I SAM-dependent methyltransferase [Pseudomonadales bacterium]MDP7596006.1 class I SAM-dependent methyltransferase [Pseudomonadales bacterium]HJN52782.1 class I SAM-dependent methyltransferase [Pseudomonadales bacterium]|tara:strand:+ start:202 stop:969 length:768 start_codon:yes stop_codon:yes gene_type:complete